MSTDNFISVGFNHWDEAFKKIHPSKIQDLERTADGLCQQYALLSGYLSLRGAAGCGDHGHEDAMKEANKKLKKVRKALGFTYP